MKRVVQIKEQLSEKGQSQLLSGQVQQEKECAKEQKNNQSEQKDKLEDNQDLSQINFKANKYHHVRVLEDIKEILVDNVNLESLIPKIRIPEEIKQILPENLKEYLSHMQDWAVMRDGEEHKRLRRAFPQQLMQYNLTRKLNYQWISEMVDKVVQEKWDQYSQKRELEMHHEVSARIAVEMLCVLLGFKNASHDLKEKLILWSDRSADTGGRYSADELSETYLEAHRFFLDTIEKVKIALKENDESYYDLQKGVMAKLIRDEIITEKHQLANQIQMFVLGGSHNPANLISLSIGLLLENKEQYLKLREKIQQDPTQIHYWTHRATNEVLRLRPPAQVIVRFVKCPYQNKQINAKTGEAIILHLEESTRVKPSFLPQGYESTQYDLFRKDDKSYQHIGFGSGHHRCMGGETGQICAEALMEKMLFWDILEKEGKKKRDFSQIQLKSFKWEESGSFKEIQDFRINF